MKKHSTIIMVLFFFIGLLVLLYPSISNYHNQKLQTKTIINYEELLGKIEVKKYDEIFAKADEYNENLRNLKYQFIDYKNIDNYDDILNVDNHGMIGYISIDKIKVELPIYHGISDEVLSTAAGHLEGTSFPVGGRGTHAAISAHRGLSSATLFTYLDKLEIGDIFTITVLDRLITYEIDQILIVKPHDVEALKIDDEGDYVTLITCTPYGINSHRLLVRGKRIENVKEKTFISTEAFKISAFIVTPMVALPIVFILLVIIILKPVEKNLNKIKEKYIYPDKTKVGGDKKCLKKFVIY